MQILDSREIQDMFKKTLNEKGEEVAKLFHSQFEEQQYLLLYVAESVIMSLPTGDREKFIDDLLPTVKHILWPVIQKKSQDEQDSK